LAVDCTWLPREAARSSDSVTLAALDLFDSSVMIRPPSEPGIREYTNWYLNNKGASQIRLCNRPVTELRTRQPTVFRLQSPGATALVLNWFAALAGA
jgi:hypothetical protein